MAKKVQALVKLQIAAGKATPAPPVGTALGPQGVNIMDFCKNFNAKTAGQDGLIIPVVVTVFADRSYTFVLKTPPASFLVKEAAGLKPQGKRNRTKGSAKPGREVAGSISVAQVRKIAETKMKDLNANTVEAAMNIILGAAKSCGIEVKG